MDWLTKTWAGVRKAFTLRFSASRWGWLGRAVGATDYDYQAAAGDGRGNAVVMACVRWACRTFPEAPLLVSQRGRDGLLKPLPDHALTLLLERPTPFYSGLLLWQATLSDWLLSGNAYWLKVRSGQGRVVQLWWLPSWMVEPRWPDDGSVFISHYEYNIENRTYEVPVADIVHFRDGFDPNNIRKGLSQLSSLFREIATDNEASNYTASVLRNIGVPGVVISPKGDMDVGDEEAAEIKDAFEDRFRGDNRGRPLVMRAPTDIQVLSFSPEQMQLRELRRIPEERVTAIFGTPAIVVGLGAGLDRSTFANMAEAREAAYESMIIPTQRLFAADLQAQLVPDFGDPARLRLGFDYSEVRVLQDDQNALHLRAREDLKAGVITLNEAREMVGKEGDPNGDIYYLPAAVTPKASEDLLAEPEPAAATTPPDEGEDEPALRLLAAALGGKASRPATAMRVADALDLEHLFADRQRLLNGHAAE